MAFAFPAVIDLPQVDTATMIEVDRLMIEEYRISLTQMMENAGRALAILTRELIGNGSATGLRVCVLAGGGGNGGGALTAARRLSIWGAEVQICLSKARPTLAEVPKSQLAILELLEGVSISEIGDCSDQADVILDGLIGYSLSGVARGRTADLIRTTNAGRSPVIALDVPSGFDASEGRATEICIKAGATLTLALPKVGMTTPSNATCVGDLYCADISVPPELYSRLVPVVQDNCPFDNSDIVLVR